MPFKGLSSMGAIKSPPSMGTKYMPYDLDQKEHNNWSPFKEEYTFSHWIPPN